MENQITQKEAQANHDAWWNSLTDEQKQQLYDNQEKAFELTIEEINAKINSTSPYNDGWTQQAYKDQLLKDE